jgi:hypothetical protein
MKKILFFLLLATTGFAENLILENQTSYPAQDQKSTIAIQWANSAKEVDEYNKALMYGQKLNPATFQVITQSGKVSLHIPENAAYFRVLVWSKGEDSPDFHTNWVDIVPNKTYKLKADQLVPSVLMSGSGC